ncbi:hypothetical protein BDR03DRAFT_1011428 [Suillus americanus]|nr:hypothetical protein BDR03DRAFT_1011428 [Suillus americanus]
MKSTAPSSRQKWKRSLTASPERPPPAKRYQSLYQSRQSAVPAVLEYETFEMKRAVCSVSESGELKMDYSEEPEDIMVVKGWQSHIKAGKPHQGYLGQGLTKFVFWGRHNNTDCAILQCKRICSSETDNSTDLQAKLETLHLAQYFLDSFYRQAETNGVHTLPKMRWNISWAFIGKLIGKLADAPKNGEEDSRSLIGFQFLVETFCLSISLGMISGRRSDFIFQKLSKGSGELGNKLRSSI